MRLYLSSYQTGNHAERFARLVRGERRGVVILNALDAEDQDRRAQESLRQCEQLAGLGLSARALDLREHTPDRIADALGGIDFCWVRGGNVFVLREALARSGADRIIVDALQRDAFVYAGFSAGPCVLAPSLRGLELCDPVADAERVYGAHRFDGLGVLDRPFVPHLNSDGHPESELLGEVARRYEAAGTPYWALSDGDALVVDGDQTELLTAR